MPKAKPLTVVVAASLIQACSNGVQGAGNCARTQALGSMGALRSVEEDKGLLTNAALPAHTPGGYIDVDYYVDATGKPIVNYEKALQAGTATRKTRRCTVGVSFDSGGPADALRLWTADHCLQPAHDVSAVVWFYSAGEYSPIPIRPDIFNVVSRARQDSLSLADGPREFFLRAFNTHETASARAGSRSCKEVTAQGRFKALGADFSHACFSMSDLATFRAKLDKPRSQFDGSQARVWDESRLAQEKFRAYYSVVSVKAPGPGGLIDRVGEKMFFAAYNELMGVRRQEASQEFSGRAVAGQCDAAGAPCPAGSDVTVKRLQARYFSERNLTDQGVQEFSDALAGDPRSLVDAVTEAALSVAAKVGLDLIAGLTAGSNANASPLEKARNRYAASSDLIWNVVLAGARGTSALADAAALTGKTTKATEYEQVNRRFEYTFQTNMRPVDSAAGLAWRWVSSYRKINDNGKGALDKYEIHLNLNDSNDAFKRVLVLSSHKTKSPYRFEKGDSGTMIGMFVFPFGGLSTVDGEETEGVPVTILPSAGSYSEPSGPVAGSPGRDGRQTGEPEAKGAGGKEVAGGGKGGGDASSEAPRGGRGVGRGGGGAACL